MLSAISDTATGNSNLKLLPWPTSLSTVKSPPNARAKRRLMARPRPVPTPTVLSAGVGMGVAVAEKLGMRTVLIPPGAAVLSAERLSGAVVERFADDRELARPRRRVLEDELVDLHGAERGQQRVVVAGEQHVFLAAPVAAADVQAGAHAIDAAHDAVDQLGRIGQFGTRITAGR